jgi:hypothetical protein
VTAREKLQGFSEDSIDFRLLDALLTHALTALGADVVARHIIDVSAASDGLSQLAKFYIIGLPLPSKPYVIENSSCNTFSILILLVRTRK